MSSCDLANEVQRGYSRNERMSMVQEIEYPHDSDSNHLNSDVEDSLNYTQPVFVLF